MNKYVSSFRGVPMMFKYQEVLVNTGNVTPMCGPLVAPHPHGTDIIYSFLSPSHSHLPGGLRGSKLAFLSSWLHCTHTHMGTTGKRPRWRGQYRSEGIAVHVLRIHGDELRIIHRRAHHSEGEKNLKEVRLVLVMNAAEEPEEQRGRCFWFAVDHLSHVGFTLSVWNATGL